jgi:hypothetical protein
MAIPAGMKVTMFHHYDHDILREPLMLDGRLYIRTNLGCSDFGSQSLCYVTSSGPASDCPYVSPEDCCEHHTRLPLQRCVDAWGVLLDSACHHGLGTLITELLLQSTCVQHPPFQLAISPLLQRRHVGDAGRHGTSPGQNTEPRLAVTMRVRTMSGEIVPLQPALKVHNTISFFNWKQQVPSNMRSATTHGE